MSATQTPLTDEMVDQWQREASRHVEETLAQSDDWHFVYDRKVAQLAAAPTPLVQDSIPMILHCPACHAQHIDAPESEDWTNPPHRSHLCHTCGHIWRPADVPTIGVAKIETRGKNDSLPVQEAQPVAIAEGRDLYWIASKMPKDDEKDQYLYTIPPDATMRIAGLEAEREKLRDALLTISRCDPYQRSKAWRIA